MNLFYALYSLAIFEAAISKFAKFVIADIANLIVVYIFLYMQSTLLLDFMIIILHF